MREIDFIINFCCLLLWVSWRHAGKVAVLPASTLAGALRQTTPKASRWKYLAGLAALLFSRALIYDELGGGTGWAAKLHLSFVTLPFRSGSDDHLLRMSVFSALSFAWVFVVFLLALTLLSAANGNTANPDPAQRWVRAQLGWIARLPWLVKLLAPLFAGSAFWLICHPLLLPLSIVPPTDSNLQLLEQSGVIGLGMYLYWSHLICVILIIYMINNHVYLGANPIWNAANSTARNLLAPFKWLPLRAGRVDFLPLLAAALFLWIGYTVSKAPMGPTPVKSWYYQHLPF